MRQIYEDALIAQPADKRVPLFVHRARMFRLAVCMLGKGNPYELTIVKAKNACDRKRGVIAEHLTCQHLRLLESSASALLM
jgi:hypothetical protein